MTLQRCRILERKQWHYGTPVQCVGMGHSSIPCAAHILFIWWSGLVSDIPCGGVNVRLLTWLIGFLLPQDLYNSYRSCTMSLASSPDLLMRPEDKGLDLLYPTSSFDDFVNENYDLSDSDNKESFDFVEYFEREAQSSGDGSTSIESPARHESTPPQPWRKGLWCLPQEAASQPMEVAQDKRHYPHRTLQRPGFPQTQHKSYTNFSRPRVRSPSQSPSPPPQKGTKRPATGPYPASSRQSPYARQTFSREATLSPTPTYARLQQTGNMSDRESWEQDLQNFHLQSGYETVRASPQRRAQSSKQSHSQQVNAASTAHNGLMRHPIGHIHSSVSFVKQAQHCAALHPSLPNLPPYGPSMISSPHDQLVNTHLHEQNMYNPHENPWRTEPYPDPLGTHNAYPMQDNSQASQWMSPLTMNASHAAEAHSAQQFHSPIPAPTPHRPTHHILQSPISPMELPQNGLGIHYPGIDPGLSDSTWTGPSPIEPVYAYPPLPQIGPEPDITFNEPSPFSTPRHRLSPSRSPSPSISPKNTTQNCTTTARSLRSQTSPVRSSARRKSIGAPKVSHIVTSSHSRNRSTSRLGGPRTPRTPKSSSTMDFVNFTPKDSAKLLSDVAPSGSSKTRARREQEARDRRRKLSEAAVRAVKRAAREGRVDIRELEREGEIVA